MDRSAGMSITTQDDYPDQNHPPGITQQSLCVQDTTLLKPVPFIDMDKDERKIILNGLQHIKSDWEMDPEVRKKVIEKCKLDGGNRGRRGIEAGRGVFQVIFVSISHTTDTSYEAFGIFGDITITSDNNNNKSYIIYDRKFDDPEHVSTPDHEELSLCDCPIAPFMKGKVEFNLTTTNRLRFVASKDVDWSFKDNCDDEDELPVYFDNGYYAMVIYTIIPYALIGQVWMTLYGPPKSEDAKDDEDTEETINVEGEIKVYNVPLLKKNAFSLVRLDKNRSVYRVEQSRSTFAMAAYSWLCAEFSLKTGENEYATGIIGVSPTFPSSTLDCKDEDYYFSMYVEWILPDELFGLIPQPAEMTSSKYYVEVFSVFVGGRDSTLRAISGTILVRNPTKTVYIFSRKTKHPDKLSSEKKFRNLSLAWPHDRWILEDDFYMHLKLKDDEGNDICWGNLEWSRYDSIYPLRFDRRMCAVIPGEKDCTYFAAVHYSIFSNALRAKVTVTIECKGVPCSYLDVCGSIHVEYNNHDYTSAYDKEYYSIIILDRPWKYRSKVNNRSEIPLSKSLITAPSDCEELIFSVDLTVCPFKKSSTVYDDRLFAKGHLRFGASKEYDVQMLPLPLCDDQPRRLGYVMVKVEWFDLSHGSRVF